MTIRNHMAAWGWLIMSAFLLMLLLMTGVALYEGTPEGYEPLHIWVILVLFWVFGLAAGSWVFSRPLIKLIIRSREIRVVKRTLFKTEKRLYNAVDVISSEVVKTMDSEGDPYFIARIAFIDGFSTDIAEGHHNERCTHVLAEFRKKMNLPQSG